MRSILCCLLKFNLGIVFVVASFIIMIYVLRATILTIFSIFKKPCDYHIKVNASISSDGGSTFGRNFSVIQQKNIIHLKYEVSMKISGILSRFLITEIPFSIEIPKSENLLVTLHEYSGICNPEPVDGFTISSKTNFSVSATNGKSETVKITLKCERTNLSIKAFCFKLSFSDKQLNKMYSSTKVLEFTDC